MQITFHKKNVSGQKNQNTHSGQNPYSDWMFIMTIGILVALGFCFIGYLEYRNVILLGKENGTFSEKANLFDADSLDSIVSSFSEKANTVSDLRKGYPGPTDPSI